MKDFYVFILLIMWLIITLLLVCTVIGLLIIFIDEWFDFGKNLINRLIKCD